VTQILFLDHQLPLDLVILLSRTIKSSFHELGPDPEEQDQFALYHCPSKTIAMAVPIRELANEWIRIDKDGTTRQEIEKLVEEDNVTELEKRLRHRITFGTAGLRATMEAGFSRMNSVTVIQASQGLAAYILANVRDAKKRGVVIGRDARKHSDTFAQLTAAAFVEKGIKVYWFENPVHTPLVPFGIRSLNAAGGVVITASHNPAKDNGYKVYWENGCQIIPPHDAGIAAEIEKNLEPLSWDKRVASHSLLVEAVSGMVRSDYFDAIQARVDADRKLARIADDHLNFAYTAMHGVGLTAMQGMVEKLGIEKHMKVVQEQAHPDPNFPGLPFPNPEEKGSLDMAIWSADRHGVSFVLASDPDADRLAVVEKVDGNWYQYSGNELGILLASHILDNYDGDRKKLVMLASTVSSSMLATMAHKEGFVFEETLTGFKWMGNKALQLYDQGYAPRFAFEESLGYMIGAVVPDKDGIAAAAVFLGAAATWRKEKNMSPYEVLQHLYKKYGHFVDANTYAISPSPETTKSVFETIRAIGEPHPKKLGSRKIHRWRDLTNGWDSATRDHKPVLPVDPTSQMLTAELESGILDVCKIRVTIRGSGTEPKIKIYIEAHAKQRETAKKQTEETLSAVLNEWLKPQENGLTLAA
jgi:phosphoglucomutase